MTEHLSAVDRLLAERACERLVNQYARHVDDGKASAVADLFTADGTWLGADGAGMHSRDEIRDVFARREALVRRQSRHVITNVVVDVVSPMEATAVAYLINYRHDSSSGRAEHPAPMDHPKFVGEYHLSFRVVDGEWKIASLRFDLAFLRRRAASGD
jgi:uncharacterized protein (TIGR02246 family)